jgi:hypothetical protein
MSKMPSAENSKQNVPESAGQGQPPISPRLVSRSRARGERSVSEIYDSDELPVLIQLPDLATPQPCRSPYRAGGGDSPAEAEPVSPSPPKTPAPQPNSEQRATRQHIHRRPNRPKITSRQQKWLANLGQLAMAAILALILLAIIIAFKGRRASSPPHAGSAAQNAAQVAAEFTRSPIGPAADTGWDQKADATAAELSWPPSLDSGTTGDEIIQPAASNRQLIPASDPLDTASVGTRRVDPAAGRHHDQSAGSELRQPAADLLTRWQQERQSRPANDSHGTASRNPYDYPSTDALPVSGPVAVPRFSAEQWREEAEHDRVRQATRPDGYVPRFPSSDTGISPTYRR